MIIHVSAKSGSTTGELTCNGITYACALGRTGIIPDETKREGDGATPAGRWPMRRLLFRGDKCAAPKTGLPSNQIGESDGWCDAVDDPAYNSAVKLPYWASAENLWRDDDLYNLIVVLGHNDAPVRPGRGSAIFLHVAKQSEDGLAPTEGCVALPEEILKNVLESCSSETILEIALTDN
jgi:L,D-peptidoglycan transpeptidase YkuD (ErfK/YbiS/YcfS/YnhG family)